MPTLIGKTHFDRTGFCMATAEAVDADLIVPPLDEDREDHLSAGGPPLADPIGRPSETERGRIVWPYVIFLS
ncbi:MAG: hypothetical protein ACRD36_07625, partial [Candidatus Acidiferrum sp.]